MGEEHASLTQRGKYELEKNRRTVQITVASCPFRIIDSERLLSNKK